MTIPAASARIPQVARIPRRPSTPPPPRPGEGQPHSQPHLSRPAAPSKPASPAASWPLILLALPAAIATWSGWVGIGQMTGFGIVHPLPGIATSFRLNTAITLPIGVEAYAAYALRAWLSPSRVTTLRTRRFARQSALGSLTLGMAGQIAYHLLSQADTTRAPWPVTTAVACLPVLVLGMGAALAHLLHADASQPASTTQTPATPHASTSQDRSPDRQRLAQARTAAAELATAGQRISRRNLRAAGIKGSNAALGALASTLRTTPPDPQSPPRRRQGPAPT